MAQLEQAAKRLQAALDTLERVVESRGSGEDEVHRALEAARRENTALQETAQMVAQRLDKTIDRLKATLGA